MRNGNRIRSITLTAMFTAVISVSSQIIIPTPMGIPVTLQTFAIALSAYCLGARRSLAAVLIYLCLGAVGVPVFSSFQGGISIFLGPTGGFLVGFPLLAFFGGISLRFIEKSPSASSFNKWKNLAAAMLWGFWGVIGCHITGTLWFARYANAGFFEAFLLVSLPYLLKDILSVAAAYFLATRLWKALKL